jgi:[ribosomal protein S5]-alanine N-acetyltransferase
VAHFSEPRRLGRHPGWPATLGPLRTSGGLVRLRPVRLRDGGMWASIRLRDERHLAPWEPDAPGLWTQRNTVAEWSARWSALRTVGRRGLGLPFAITLDDMFAGQVMIGNVMRDPLWSAYVGYWIGSHAAGRGVTTAAVAMVLDHTFGQVGLHRIEATVRPENQASRRVLAKLGFREEGLLRRYLNVDGAWRDHLMYAMTIEDLERGVVDRIVRQGLAQRV